MIDLIVLSEHVTVENSCLLIWKLRELRKLLDPLTVSTRVLLPSRLLG